MLRSILPSLLLLPALASACGDEAAFERIRIQRRAAASSASATAATSALVAATRTDEASAAQVTNPSQECSYYSYPPVAALQAAGVFPPIWEIANLSTATAEVTALFTTLNSSIPNIAPKGTPTGNFTGVNYDGVNDNDCWWTWKQCTTPKLAGLAEDVSTCPEPNTWGFTLDDGPNCSHNAYYDYLQEQNQKATLFYIGSNVVDWPLEAQRGLADGHEIAAHTWSHRYMTSLSNEQAFAELYYAKKAIKDVLGVTVQAWRPPYGDVDDRIRYIANALGMSTVLWQHNTFDYLYSTTGIATVQANYNDILAEAANGTFATQGTIVLSHELDNETMSISESYLPKIKAAFAHVVPVGVCQNNTQPYVETGYTYPNFAQYAAGTTSISLLAPTAVSTDASLVIPLSTGVSGSVSATVGFATATSAAAASAAAKTASASGSASAKSAAAPGSPLNGFFGVVAAVVVGAVGAGVGAVLI